MKIKFNSDNVMPLGKTLDIHDSVIVIRSVFDYNNTYYSQVF